METIHKILIFLGIGLLVFVGIFALAMRTNKKFGTAVNYDINSFVQGIVIGTADNPACIKMADVDNSGNHDGSFTYITTDDGVVSSSTSTPFAGACASQ